MPHIEFFYRPECCFVLPGLIIEAAQCECCENGAWCITVQWLWWGCGIVIQGGKH